MTIKQILELDCREKENENIIQKELHKIKPLARYEDDVPFDSIEKVISIMSKKYSIRIHNIVPDVWANDSKTIWRVNVVEEHDLKMTNVYGISLYEVFAKCSILMYYKVKNGLQSRK